MYIVCTYANYEGSCRVALLYLYEWLKAAIEYQPGRAVDVRPALRAETSIAWIQTWVSILQSANITM